MAQNIKKPNNKLYRAEVRLTLSEKRTLIANAKKSGLSLSEYIRKVSLAPTNYIPSPETRINVKQLINEVNHIGVNINQIAKNTNSGFYTEYEKKKLFALIKELNDKLNNTVTILRGEN